MQFDSADLTKALDESQRRFEQFKRLFFDVELELELELDCDRASVWRSTQGQMSKTLKREISEDDDEEDEKVRKIDSRTVGPFAAIGKDSRKVKTNINQR
jgi:hypothetical protein